MGRRLARTVVVRQGSRNVVFKAGDEVPAWAAEKITSPWVWDDDDTEHESSRPAPGPQQPRAPAAAAGRDLPVPPRYGKGSGADVWAEYAASHGVATTDDMTRSEIVAALDRAGVPTE